MERITLESIQIVVGREEDGRCWADIESRCAPPPIAWNKVTEIPEPFTKVFSVA